jgi:FAD dependent oxidoreductase TIGR03364
MRNAEVAVIGGGIVGLAFAYAHAKRGRKVVLFERTDFAVGASVRNFGLLWPVGQPFGNSHDRAMRSREIWLEVIKKAGLWHAPTGSLHLAYAQDEFAVLEEYMQNAGRENFGRELLGPAAVREKSDTVRSEGLIGALWSPTEINVDPRQATRNIPAMLRQVHQVDLQFGVTVREISLPRLSTPAGEWEVEEAIVCSGADFETLYPEVFGQSGLTRCKLQMLRTPPQRAAWHLGPSLCAGLTLAHYDCFKKCASLAPLKKRFAREMPFYVDNGIHLLLSETASGELTIGDSHHYGLTLEPFDRDDVDRAILDYLATFAQGPNFAIAERWHGVYPKLPGRTEFIADPEEGVKVVTGLGGAGMTLSFGLAEEIVANQSAI